MNWMLLATIVYVGQPGLMAGDRADVVTVLDNVTHEVCEGVLVDPLVADRIAQLHASAAMVRDEHGIETIVTFACVEKRGG